MGATAVRLTNVDIDNALKNNHFDVIFQPVFNLEDGGLARVEAFVRWTHPGLGVLPPGAFISFFETQGRMSELTRHVIESALEAYQNWRGAEGPGFSVNLAMSDLTDESFPGWLTELLASHRFPAELLTLECPLPPTPDTLPTPDKAFMALKQTGCPLAIEIRGRANDALMSLDPFPFVEVKTGGSAILRFARTVRGGPGLTAISELLELAKANDAKTVAVGVEDQASLTALSSLGFSGAQGNYLAGVTDLAGVSAGSINTVRDALGFEPLDQDSVLEKMGVASSTKSDLTEEVSVEETVSEDEPEATGEDALDTSDDEERRQKKIEAAKEALRKKKLKAREMAKLKAAKKARAAREAAEKAEIELAEQQKERQEALAAKAVAANARKLQNRLSRAFDDEETETPLELSTPVAAEEAETPAAEISVEIDPQELEASVEIEQDTLEAPAEIISETLESEADTPITDDIFIEETASSDISEEVTIEHKLEVDRLDPSEETDVSAQADEAIAETIVEISEIAEDHTNDIAQETDIQYTDEKEPAPVAAAAMLTEDEVLDKAFWEAEVLDPEEVTDHGRDPNHPVHQQEAALLARLTGMVASPALRNTSKKNFLQRRYQIPKITHFWPRSWTRNFNEKRAEKQAQRDLDVFDE